MWFDAGSHYMHGDHDNDLGSPTHLASPTHIREGTFILDTGKGFQPGSRHNNIAPFLLFQFFVNQTVFVISMTTSPLQQFFVMFYTKAY